MSTVKKVIIILLYVDSYDSFWLVMIKIKYLRFYDIIYKI